MTPFVTPTFTGQYLFFPKDILRTESILWAVSLRPGCSKPSILFYISDHTGGAFLIYPILLLTFSTTSSLCRTPSFLSLSRSLSFSSPFSAPWILKKTSFISSYRSYVVPEYLWCGSVYQDPKTYCVGFPQKRLQNMYYLVLVNITTFILTKFMTNLPETKLQPNRYIHQNL